MLKNCNLDLTLDFEYCAMDPSRCSGFRKDGLQCKRRNTSNISGVWTCHTHMIDPIHSKSLHSETAATAVSDKPDCVICMDTISSENNAALKCNHDFHLSCILKLRNNSCPVCRKPLKSPRLTNFNIKKIKGRQNRDIIERNAAFAETVDAEAITDQIEEVLYNTLQDFAMLRRTTLFLNLCQIYNNICVELQNHVSETPHDFVYTMITLINRASMHDNVPIIINDAKAFLMEDVPRLYSDYDSDEIKAMITTFLP